MMVLTRFWQNTSSYQHVQTIVIDTKAGVDGNDFYLTKYSFHTIWNPNGVAMNLYGNNDAGSTWNTIVGKWNNLKSWKYGAYYFTIFSPANSSGTIYRYLKFRIGYTSASANCAFTKWFKFWGDYKATTSSATGSFEGNNITAPSTT